MLCSELEIRYPIFQAGMAGGITTPELVAGVSNFGGLGIIGAGYMSASELKLVIHLTKKLTAKNFGVNLFIPEQVPRLNEDELKKMIHYLNELTPENKIAENWEFENKGQVTFNEQLEIIMSEKIKLCSFTFGLPQKELVKDLQKLGIKVMGTATTVNEALHLEENGVDFIVAQGSEAGGHREHRRRYNRYESIFRKASTRN